MTNFTGHDLYCLRGGRMVFGGLDFSLSASQALVLVGPNGSGKSTLLRVMAGLLAPIMGELRWDGESVLDDPEARRGRVHYVGHLEAIKPVLTVAENLRFWSGLGGPVDDRRLDRALETLGLSALADLPGRMLSAGQKRRVNLARVIAGEAPLWLLDEPTTALDRQSIGALERAIADHRAAGGMVVLSTHSDLAIDQPITLDLSHFSVDSSEMDFS